MTVLNQEWLTTNAYRAYPLREDSEFKTVEDPNVILPNYVVVDFVLAVASDSMVQAKLSSFSYVGGYLSIIVSDASDVIIGSTAINTATHISGTFYNLAGQGTYESAKGRIVIGDLTNLSRDLPQGAYTLSNVYFEVSTVKSDPVGVRSISLVRGDTTLSSLDGNIILDSGNNIRLTKLPTSNSIRIDVVGGEGMTEEVTCDDGYELPEPIRTINGVNAEDVQIVGDGKCVEVSVSGNQLIIKDTCSQPCCGCKELEYLTSKLEILESTVNVLEQFIQTFQNETNLFIQKMVAS